MMVQAAASYGDQNPTGRRPGIPALNLAHHRIARAHRGEPRAVDVQREDPLHLRPDLRDQVSTGLGRADDLGRHGPGARLPGVLPHSGTDGPPAALHSERELQHVRPGPGCTARA